MPRLLILLSSAAALASSPPRAVRFGEALGIAESLPALVAEREAAADERAIALPLAWGPLMVTATPQARLAPRDARGPEGVIAIQQAIPLANLAGVRRSHVDATARVHEARATAALLEARLAAASAWIAGWAARERLAAAERDLALAREVAARTERGGSAGVFTAPEVADARAFAAEAALRRDDAEGALAEAGFALGRALASPEAIATAGDLPEVPLPAAQAWQDIADHARRVPAVTARVLAARAARARAREDRAARGVQLIAGAELYRDGPGALAGGVTIGLAWPHDRGQREAREAEIEAAVAEGDAAELAARAAHELAAALHDVAHTGEVLAGVRDHLVPAADDAANRRQRAFELGETTVVELLAARRTAVAAHARLADARAAHTWSRLRAWLVMEAAR